MVTGTELKKQQHCFLRHAGRSQSAPSAIVPQSQGGSRWPLAIRIRQDASVTTAKPAIAVARDQVIYRVAGHPWDEWRTMSTASAEASRQCAARLRILDRPGRSPLADAACPRQRGDRVAATCSMSPKGGGLNRSTQHFILERKDGV